MDSPLISRYQSTQTLNLEVESHCDLNSETMPLVAGKESLDYKQSCSKGLSERDIAIKNHRKDGERLGRAVKIIIEKTEKVVKVDASDIKEILSVLEEIKERNDLPEKVLMMASKELYAYIGTSRTSVKNLSNQGEFDYVVNAEKAKGKLSGIDGLLGGNHICKFITDLYEWAKRCNLAAKKIDEFDKKREIGEELEMVEVLQCPVPLIPPPEWSSGSGNDGMIWLELIVSFLVQNLMEIRDVNKRIIGDKDYKSKLKIGEEQRFRERNAERICRESERLMETALLGRVAITCLMEDVQMGEIQINSIVESKSVKMHFAKCFSFIKSQMRLSLSPHDLSEIRSDSSTSI